MGLGIEDITWDGRYDEDDHKGVKIIMSKLEARVTLLWEDFLSRHNQIVAQDVEVSKS